MFLIKSAFVGKKSFVRYDMFGISKVIFVNSKGLVRNV